MCEIQRIEDLAVEAKSEPLSKDDLFYPRVFITAGDGRYSALYDIVLIQRLFRVDQHELRLVHAHQLEVKEVLAELLPVDIDEGSSVDVDLIQHL